MEFPETAIRAFLEYARASGMDWLYFREDTRAPPPAGGLPDRFPAVRKRMALAAAAYSDFRVYYTAPTVSPSPTRTCYFRLTDFILVRHPPTGGLLMVACEHHIPGGLADIPPEGTYQIVEPATLYAARAEQLRRFLSSSPPACPRPDHCCSPGRNHKTQIALDNRPCMQNPPLP